MAILGTLINTIAATSFAAAAQAAPTTSFASLVHSLPSIPQTVIPVVTSIEATAGNGYAGAPQLLACGANASIATVGVAYGSGVTVPEIAYETVAILWHSKIN